MVSKWWPNVFSILIMLMQMHLFELWNILLMYWSAETWSHFLSVCCLHRSLLLESLSWGSLQQYGIHHPHCPRPHWIPPWSSRETDSPVAPPPNQSQRTANLKIITKHKKWFFIGFDGSMKNLCTTIAPKVLCSGRFFRLYSSQNGSLKISSLKVYLGNLKVVIWHHCENGLLELLF